MTNSVFCPSLLANGYCHDKTCKRNHIAFPCEPCSMVLRTSGEYKAHLEGRRHLNTIRKANALLVCPVCDVVVPGVAGFKQHCSGARHVSKAKDQGLDPATVELEEPENFPGYTLCTVCNEQILDRFLSRHSSSGKHAARLRFMAYNNAIDNAEKDKNGVSIEGDFDFKIVTPDAARAGVQIKGALRCSVPSSSISVVEAKLASSKGKGVQSSFSFQFITAERVLTSRKMIQFSVTAKQKFPGRGEDRLEVTFEDQQLGSRFVIIRSLRIIVGNKADYELLKPVAPYKPRKRTDRPAVAEVVEGVPAPALSAIPYITRLPPAKMTARLRQILASSQQEALTQIKQVFLPSSFSVDTYAKHFKCLLWVEEYRMEVDLEMYDITNTNLSAHNRYFYLGVPGLAEKRPSVLVGDSILLQSNKEKSGRWFEGVVHAVRRDDVLLRFGDSFRSASGQTFNARFRLNRICLRRQHYAMDTAFNQARILFPTSAHILPQSQSRSLTMCNPLIANNPAQVSAVSSIVHSRPGSVPFVVFGPPGTGKTVTIVEAIRQLLKLNPNVRILACAPSNSAADLIAIALVKSKNSNLGKTELFRAYAPSRSKEQVPDELRDFYFTNLDGHFSVPDIATVKHYRVIVTTCASASIMPGIGLPRGHFSHIFVDEAGQATEPEVMIGIKTLADNSTNVVLSGDPKQLGPIIRSSIARKLGLETSFIERLMQLAVYDEQAYNAKTIVKLVQNFRSHPSILKFPNEHFYGGDLKPYADKRVIDAYLTSQHVVKKGFPVVFHAVFGRDDREASSPSFFNIDEASLVKTLIDKLRSDRGVKITDNDIGVITPYHAQCLKIRALLRPVFSSVKVGSVEEFQGQERKVIIISTVRSSREFVEYDLKHTLGFVANPRRFNVAVTRAQALLMIVGDPNVLSLDPLWREFLNFIHINGGWTGTAPSWDTSAPVDGVGGYDSVFRQHATEDMNDLSRTMESLTISNMANGAASVSDDFDANIDRPWQELE